MATSYQFVVSDPVGLHAKPLTMLVNEASRFDSDIKLIYEAKSASLKSIMGVMALGIPTKAKLEIIAEGQDEVDAINHLKDELIKLHITD